MHGSDTYDRRRCQLRFGCDGWALEGWARGTGAHHAPFGALRRCGVSAETGPAEPGERTFSYVPLLKQIVRFFQTGTPPVSNAETLEIFAFLDAAQRSKEGGGKPVKLR